MGGGGRPVRGWYTDLREGEARGGTQFKVMINLGNLFFFSKFEALLSTSTIVVFMSKD